MMGGVKIMKTSDDGDEENDDGDEDEDENENDKWL